MKGIVFNIFQSFVEKNMGEDAWDEVLEEAQIEQDFFVAPETYEDKDFLTLVTHTIEKFKLVPSEAIRLFGNFSFPLLISKVPQFKEEFKSAKDFLKGLDSIIHVEVRKLLPGAKTPRFYHKERDDGSLELEYESDRNLPDFVIGLIEGLGKHYKEEIKVQLMGNNNNKYQFLVEFA
ncbi:MAG: heme NO-binding domain-containing protein [Bacteriovoracaceae bacterium]|jgi:hypothetical protein|nr:heme NO-binding domain-containing protein [Bacteriovoracaceae bacterium]